MTGVTGRPTGVRGEATVARLEWPAGKSLVRAHLHEFGSTEFDRRPSRSPGSRFAPLGNPPIGVIYLGSDARTASAETIFHTVAPAGRPRRVPLDRYVAWQWSTIAAPRPLSLVRLDDSMPRAARLVDGDATTYASSRHGAEGLLLAESDADGLVWCSRQLYERPSRRDATTTDDLCILLLERSDRRAGGVARDELEGIAPSVPFLGETGRELLDEVADDLDVTVV